MSNDVGVPFIFWSLIWECSGPERVRTFLSQLALDRLYTRELRHKRFGDPINCAEDDLTQYVLHALRDCKGVKEVWQSIINVSSGGAFFDLQLIDWLELNLSDKGKRVQGIEWRVIFGLVVRCCGRKETMFCLIAVERRVCSMLDDVYWIWQRLLKLQKVVCN